MVKCGVRQESGVGLAQRAGGVALPGSVACSMDPLSIDESAGRALAAVPSSPLLCTTARCRALLPHSTVSPSGARVRVATDVWLACTGRGWSNSDHVKLWALTACIANPEGAQALRKRAVCSGYSAFTTAGPEGLRNGPFLSYPRSPGTKPERPKRDTPGTPACLSSCIPKGEKQARSQHDYYYYYYFFSFFFIFLPLLLLPFFSSPLCPSSSSLSSSSSSSFLFFSLSFFLFFSFFVFFFLLFLPLPLLLLPLLCHVRDNFSRMVHVCDCGRQGI